MSFGDTVGWNCTFLVIFELPIGTPNIWYLFVLWPLILFWYSFYRNLIHVSWKFLLTTHNQDQTNVLILLIVLGIYISWFFSFFLPSDSLWLRITTCAYNPCSVSNKNNLRSFNLVWSEVHLDCFYISLNFCWRYFCFFKIWIFNNFIYWYPKWLFFTGNVFNVYIHCFLIFQSLLLLFHCNNITLLVIIDFMYFYIYISIIICLFNYISSSSNNHSGFFPPPETDRFIVFLVTLAFCSSTTGVLLNK